MQCMLSGSSFNYLNSSKTVVLPPPFQPLLLGFGDVVTGMYSAPLIQTCRESADIKTFSHLVQFVLHSRGRK